MLRPTSISDANQPSQTKPKVWHAADYGMRLRRTFHHGNSGRSLVALRPATGIPSPSIGAALAAGA